MVYVTRKAEAYKIGKEFFRLSKKNFPLSSNLYKNTVTLSCSCKPNVANSINRSNTKNSGIIKVLGPLNEIVSIKLIAPLRGNINMNIRWSYIAAD